MTNRPQKGTHLMEPKVLFRLGPVIVLVVAAVVAAVAAIFGLGLLPALGFDGFATSTVVFLQTVLLPATLGFLGLAAHRHASAH